MPTGKAALLLFDRRLQYATFGLVQNACKQSAQMHECLVCKLAESCSHIAAGDPAWQTNYLILSIFMKMSHTARVYRQAVMLYDAACAGWRGGFAAFAALQDDRQQQQVSNQSRLAAPIAGQAPFVLESLQLHLLWCRITSVCLLAERPDKAACSRSHLYCNECCYEGCHDSAHVAAVKCPIFCLHWTTCCIQPQHSQQFHRHCLLTPLMSPEDTECN